MYQKLLKLIITNFWLKFTCKYTNYSLLVAIKNNYLLVGLYFELNLHFRKKSLHKKPANMYWQVRS